MTFKMPSTWLNRPLDIIVVGAGGTGSALITELFQMSYLLDQISDGQVHFNVTVFDDDVVSPFNIGRQSFWGADKNRPKSEVLVKRFNTFGGINWEYEVSRFEPKDLLNRKCDLLITCTDSAETRAAIGKYFSDVSNPRKTTLWLDTGNDSNTSQVVLGSLGKCKNYLPNVFDLFPSLATMKDDKTESCSHEQALNKQDYSINKRTALEATNLMWRLIRDGEISRHGSFVDTKDGVTSPLPIDEQHWAMLGYVMEKEKTE